MLIFKVKNTKLISPKTLLLTLRPRDSKDRLRFYPGQYAAIGFRLNGRPSPARCFSIVTSPNNTNELQFAMRIYGKFTRALASLEPGDEVFVHGPFGNFVIDQQYDQNIIMMAGGIGITPFMSMLRYAAETGLTIPITLLYSCGSQDNIPFYEEITELEKRNPRFKPIFFVTSGGIDKLAGERAVPGRINSSQLEQLTHGQYNRFTHFICGPGGFIKTMRAVLIAHATDPEQIITEEFTPSAKAESFSPIPRHSISRWTYGLTAASLAMGTAFIMTIDLARAIPRLVNAQATQAASSVQKQPAVAGTSNSPSAQSTSSSNSSSSETVQPTQTNQPAQSSYQAPITSVS